MPTSLSIGHATVFLDGSHQGTALGSRKKRREIVPILELAIPLSALPRRGMGERVGVLAVCSDSGKWQNLTPKRIETSSQKSRKS
jgi:hypothetical protein